jgi:hypothetical protein
MPRTKKFASKQKFRGNEYVRVNKETGVSEKETDVMCNAEYPQPPPSFSTHIYNKNTGSAVADVSVSSMMQAAREAVAENEKDDPSHITACFDGTWQKHGHTSLNGITSATSFDTGKVDVETMGKFHVVCHTNPTSQHECKKNYEGTHGGMEGAGEPNIFYRSLHTLRYLLHKVSW